ncbi:MAG TPA: SRPBCC domain-containing protein, partial [Bacteroidota bacterium]|nr:SRPBCC domain-containing protein [Bacteroidota bacterium]
MDETPEKVYHALTTVDGLSRWWISTAAGDTRSGGIIDF